MFISGPVLKLAIAMCERQCQLTIWVNRFHTKTFLLSAPQNTINYENWSLIEFVGQK